MFAIKRIDHVVLRTDKLPQMIDFYCRVLGCTIERQTEQSLGLTQLRAGDALIDLVAVDSELGRQGGDAPDGNAINMDHLCLLLEPCHEQDILQKLDDNQISHGGFEQRYGSEGFGRSIYLQDPQGNTLELRASKLMESAHATGDRQ